MNLIDVSYGLPRAGLPSVSSLRRFAHAALVGRREDVELSIRLVGHEEGRALNRDYRGKDYATNVLSFPAELPPGVPLSLMGDLVICAPVIAREALEQNKALKDHYAHMIVHGMLHLLGHDHEIESEAEMMEQIECEILAALGIADPYQDQR